MAAERGIRSVVTSTCKVMGMKALQASNTSSAMARALRQEMPNDAGISLQDYFKSVCEGETEENAAKVLFKEFSLEGGFDFSTLSGYGCIVVNCSPISRDHLAQIQNLKSINKSLSVLVLFVDQKEAIEAFTFFADGDLQPKLIFFALDSPT